MGLMEKIVSKSTSSTANKLTAEEYEFLFVLIRNSTFKGENLELIYNLTLKLQEEYINHNKEISSSS